MKVSSPIGDLPFEPRSLKIKGRGLEMEGVMGAWPAKVQIELADIGPMVRLIAKPAASVVAVIVVLTLAGKGLSHSARQ